MRIVHLLNFSFNNNGQAFGNIDQKLQHGFAENGYYSYAFPCNDIARQLSWRGSKSGGQRAMNQSLRESCRKIQPDVLVLGHAQLVYRETLEEIKTQHPSLKIIQWFVDPMKYRRVYQFILDRHDLLDAVYLSSGGEALAQFQSATCQAYYLPNAVHPCIERARSFKAPSHQYDLIFVGSDQKDPERRALLEELYTSLSKDFRIGIFGSLGQPRIHGKERDLLFQSSKASLNLTRHAPASLYSSDRIAQIMGNGLLACTHAGAQLDEVYGPECLLTYHSASELASKLKDALSTGKWKTMAQNGWETIHHLHSAKKIAANMIEALKQ